ncbi:YncE family protein [Marilutibacter spongiae]|uniref:YncE family protein n=1 Tax=Marilutibacter spongiae TaxID=2025720 RepID=A0A7W3TML2_9GAMM|nr:YncE family protein [Lysobacter spongiae]MBB1061103.1 YncE family protein [Lysobacter spongiae]
MRFSASGQSIGVLSRAGLTACLLALPLAGVAGDLLVGNKSADTVWRLSTEDGRRVGAIDTGVSPHEIAVSPDGRRALVTNYGGDAAGNSLTLIDLEGGEAPRAIALGENGRPHGVRFLPDGKRAAVTTEASGALLLVDVDAGEVVARIGVGDGTGHMVAIDEAGDTAYVSKIAAGTVSRVDLGAEEKTLERPSGEGAEGIAVRPGSGEVWVSNRAAGTVTVHDPDSLDLLHTLESPGFPIRVVFTADGDRALVTNARAAELAVFDAGDKTRMATVKLLREGARYRETLLGRDALPIGVIADPQRPRVYVAISGADEIAVIDTATWRVIDHWPTGREPDALALTH